jgi:hypothetical protein
MDFLPGFLQGITRVMISHPFDNIRLHLQTNTNENMRQFIKQHGIKSVYRGVGFPLLTVPLERALQYRLYEVFNTKQINPYLSGGLCGLISCCLSLPSSYLCNTYVLNKNLEAKQHIHSLMTKENVKKLILGYKPEIVRAIVSSTIYLGVYGNMRTRFGNESYQPVINGATSAIVLWTVTYPLETVKVEQQVKNTNAVVETLQKRVQQYGFMNLYKGILPVYLRTLPSAMAGMYVYETTRKWVQKKN